MTTKTKGKSAARTEGKPPAPRGPVWHTAGRGKSRTLAPVDDLVRAEFDALRARIEDLEDIVHMREVEARTKPQDYLPIELVDRMISGERPVRIWREHRGLSLSALAKKAGLPVGYLSEIERGKKPGSVAAYKALAAALDIDIDDLV